MTPESEWAKQFHLRVGLPDISEDTSNFTGDYDAIQDYLEQSGETFDAD